MSLINLFVYSLDDGWKHGSSYHFLRYDVLPTYIVENICVFYSTNRQLINNAVQMPTKSWYDYTFSLSSYTIYKYCD